ncbi:MAG: preprotein translocase subunit SecG [Gammaproteobacteria bacterium]|nr:MAG: preprotein translocase subunit SecG [Gammaproteobacteria bacterium]
MYTLLIVLDVLLAMALIGLVMLQQGKGADAGAAFGSGASSTVFGAAGGASVLTKITTGLAIGFFIVNLALAYVAKQRVTEVVAPQKAPSSVVEKYTPAAEIPEVVEQNGEYPVSEVPQSSIDIPEEPVSSAQAPGMVDDAEQMMDAANIPDSPPAEIQAEIPTESDVPKTE